MLYDLRTGREHVVFSRRQQADAGRCETELHVVGAVQFPRIKIQLHRQLNLVYHIREGVEVHVGDVAASRPAWRWGAYRDTGLFVCLSYEREPLRAPVE